MIQNIKNIVRTCPRASFANPSVRLDENSGDVIVRAGSGSDAARFIAALRGAGYDCNLLSPYDSKVIRVAL